MNKIIGLLLIAVVMIAALGCSGGNRENSSQEHSGETINMVVETSELNHQIAEGLEALAVSMPPQTYVGRWGEANNYLHILIIYDEEGHREINFFWYISGRIETRATALLQNNRIVFDIHDDTGHVEDYVYYPVRGTMSFGENGILLSIERSSNPMIRAGEMFLYSSPLVPSYIPPFRRQHLFINKIYSSAPILPYTILL